RREGGSVSPSDTRPTEQRSPRPISAQPEGRHVLWAEALLLAPYRSTAGYARRSRLASAQNPLPRMYSYFGDTTLGTTSSGGVHKFAGSQDGACRKSKPAFLLFALSALLSVQIVANRDDFRSAEFIPPERELRQHALDNSPTLFVDQPSCGLKSALLWLRLRRAAFSVFFAV